MGAGRFLSDAEEPQSVSLILWCVRALGPAFDWLVLLDRPQMLVLLVLNFWYWDA